MNIQDFLGEDNKLGADIWRGKYEYEGEGFDKWLDRISGGDEELKEVIKSKKFLFGGRILANRGLDKKDRKITYSNCYVIAPPEDNIESIFDCAGRLARTFSYGGGCGVDISKLSPRGAKVNNSAKETTGSVSFMDLYSLVTELIGQNGRRGALMLSLDCTHPDLEEFIEIKSDLDKVTKANISIKVTKEFMEAVKNDTDFELSFTRKETSETVTKVIKAKSVFEKLAKMNWDMAEPGILYWDRITEWNLLSECDYFEYAGTNPCLVGDTLIQTIDGEIPIRDLVGKTPYVYCMDENGKLSIKQSSKVWLTKKNAELVKVITGKGEIICTPNHKIFTTNRGWVEAESLTKGDKIKGLNRQTTGHKYCSVGLSGTPYEKEHRFVARHFMDVENKDVHHINDDGFDNRISNLEVINHDEHSVISNTGRQIEIERDELGRFSEKEEKKQRDTKSLGKSVGVNWFVKEVVYLDYTEDVYDMTVPDVHNFVANDMVVHNCAEEPLPAGGSCLLGSINLSEFVENPFTDKAHFNYKVFEDTVRISVKALNDVLDEGLPLHPLQEQRDSVRDWRQIGLGIMGLADMLIKMGIRYGSKESIDLCNHIGFRMINSSIKASALLAKDEGVFPEYDYKYISKSKFFINNTDKEVKKLVKEFGLRNSQLLTVAPTGSISTMLRISGGIEPIFANYYTRTTKSLHKEGDVAYKVYTHIVDEYMKSNGIEDDKELPSFFVTAQTLDYKERIIMQSIWQEHIDASISSTVNVPENFTVEEVFDLYMKAHEAGLKGITIFRENCSRVGILTTTKESEPTQEVQAPQTESLELGRGVILDVNNDLLGMKRTIVNGCGKFYAEVYFDEVTGEPLETFLNMGSGGSCERNIQFISRLISLALRGGIPIESIIDQALSIRPCKAYTDRTSKKGDTSKGTSCPSAVGYALKELQQKINERCFTDFDFEDEEEATEVITNNCENCNGCLSNDKVVQKEISSFVNKNDKTDCPECGEKLIFEGGCRSCVHCGWTKCE